MRASVFGFPLFILLCLVSLPERSLQTDMTPIERLAALLKGLSGDCHTANLKRFSYLAGIVHAESNQLKCTGISIHPRYILTSGWCVHQLKADGLEDDVIVLLINSSSNNTSSTDLIQVLHPSEFIVHVDYDGSRDGDANLALIKLRSKSSAQYARIASVNSSTADRSSQQRVNLLAVDWESSRFAERCLTTANVTAIEGSRCHTSIQGPICTELDTWNISQENTGGPLVLPNSGEALGKGKPELDKIVGIASLVHDNRTTIRVYVPIAPYSDWVFSEIEQRDGPCACPLPEQKPYDDSINLSPEDEPNDLAIPSPEAEPNDPAIPSPEDEPNDPAIPSSECDPLDPVDDSVIIDAFRNGNKELVEILIIEKCVDMETKDDDGRTLLFLAAYHNHTRVVNFLVDQGAATETIVDDRNNTVLSRIVLFYYPEVVQVLIKAGANVNHTNIGGETPLILASSKGYLVHVEHLIRYGAFVDAQDEYGKSALIISATLGHLSVVQFLLKAGASTDLETNDGYSALSLAKKGDHESVVSVLSDANG